ncbi:MAG: hypothetical protein ACLRFH_03845 [Opitutales bacterium]
MKNTSIGGFGLAAILLLGGCQSTPVGPRALRSSQHKYNQAIVQNSDEQLLANIVRLRYRDNPIFVDVTQMVQNVGFDSTLDNNWEKGVWGSSFSGKVSGKLGLSDKNSATNTYSQLNGKDFVAKMMTPIQLPIILSMFESGWRPERVFNLCVERINNLYNAPTASGPTPVFAPEYAGFFRFSELLDRLERNHLIELGEENDVNFSDLFMHIKAKPAFEKEIAEFKRLADLNPDANKFKLKSDFAGMSSSKLVMRGKTLLGIFFFLSQGVEVPQADKDAGLVTVTKNADGTEFDWSPIFNKLLKVQFSEGTTRMRPENAYVAYRYRGKWFYIADNDLESKSTFMMLSQLFTLQSAKYNKSEPILVVTN